MFTPSNVDKFEKKVMELPEKTVEEKLFKAECLRALKHFRCWTVIMESTKKTDDEILLGNKVSLSRK